MRTIRERSSRSIHWILWTMMMGAMAVSTSRALAAFTDIGAGLTPVAPGTVAWGDYDSDGDLDILLTGEVASGTPTSKVYRNDGTGGFIDIGAGLTGNGQGPLPLRPSSAWGDYDNDGDLDILLNGWDGASLVAKVYRNDGAGSFVDIGALPPGRALFVAWGDYDNDGDLDILFGGRQVFRNDGAGGFADIGVTLVSGNSGAWGDYDNDGDLDFVIGRGLGSVVFRNDGAGSFVDIGAGLPRTLFSSVAWGDYDNDGDLDFVLTGYDPVTRSHVANVYRNDGAGSFVDIGAGLAGANLGSVAWGDYDNDGDLDILLTGTGPIGPPGTKLYRNDGGVTFTDVGAAGLRPLFRGGAVWGDYDNDSDLDVVLAGDCCTGVFRNDGPPPNAPPAAPAGLGASVIGSQATLSWNATTDDRTPSSGLSYNLRVGTTPGGNEISAAMADGTTGYRRVAQLGNAQHNLSWTLTLPPGAYYWSVQAVDAAWAGSPFPAEQRFAVCSSTIVTFDLDPNTLNLRSMGRWVTGTLEPEPPASPADIDVASILLNGTVPVDPSGPVSIGDADGDGIPDLTVKFDRTAVGLSVDEGDAVKVTVTGEIGSGCFEASDVIRVKRGHVSAPTAGSVLQGGSTFEVRWDTPSAVHVESVAILSSTDDGAAWSLVARELPNTGNYLWTVPNVGTDRARVAVVLVESSAKSSDEVNGVLAVSDRFVISSLLGVGNARVGLALHGAVPNPSRGLDVSFSLTNDEPATLRVFDVSGREVSRREVGGLGTGRHVVSMAAPGTVAPGNYLIHLVQGDRKLVARAAVIR